MGLTFFLAVWFFLRHTPDGNLSLLLSLGGPVHGSAHQCSYFIVTDIFSSGFWSLEAPTTFRSTSWSKSSSFRCLLRGRPGHRKTILGPSKDGQSSPRACWAFPLLRLVPQTVPSTCSFFYSHQSRRLPSTTLFNYAFKWLHQVAGVNSPTPHPTVISAKEGVLRLVSHPASRRKDPSRWPISSNFLKGLTLAISCN